MRRDDGNVKLFEFAVAGFASRLLQERHKLNVIHFDHLAIHVSLDVLLPFAAST